MDFLGHKTFLLSIRSCSIHWISLPYATNHFLNNGNDCHINHHFDNSWDVDEYLKSTLRESDKRFLTWQEIAELYEQEQNLEQAILYYEKAADLFQSEDVTTSANQCKQKIAQYAAQLEQLSLSDPS